MVLMIMIIIFQDQHGERVSNLTSASLILLVSNYHLIK